MAGSEEDYGERRYEVVVISRLLPRVDVGFFTQRDNDLDRIPCYLDDKARLGRVGGNGAAGEDMVAVY